MKGIKSLSWLDQLGPFRICYLKKKFSFKQIRALTYEKIKYFKTHSLQMGDVVACSGSKLELLLYFLACMELGIVFCPVPLEYSRKEGHGFLLKIKEGLKNSRKVLWINAKEQLVISSSYFPQWQFLDEMKRPAILLQTSGTSSCGKYVGYEYDSLLHQIKTHASALKVYSQSSRLQILPLYHTFGLVLDLCLGLYLGQSIDLVETSEIKIALKLAKEKAFDIAATPKIAHLISKFCESNHPKLLHVGGARVAPKFKESLESSFQTVVEGYGLTECGPGVLLFGKPLGCRVRLKKFENSLKGVGLLQVKSPTMGFWKQRDSNLEKKWYTTGDLAEQKGELWSILGRLDRHIKGFDGTWIWLDQLEAMWERKWNLTSLSLEATSCGSLRITLLESERLHKAEIIHFAKHYFASHFGSLDIEVKTTGLTDLLLSKSKSILAI